MSVTVCARLVVFVGWPANVKLLGDRLTTGAVPVPVRETVCGLPLALSVIVMAPVRVPVAVGVRFRLLTTIGRQRFADRW